MSGPSSVGDSGMRVEDFGEIRLGLFDELLQFRDFADLLEGKDLALLVAIYGETSGIVSSVLKSRKAFGSDASESIINWRTILKKRIAYRLREHLE